MSCLGGFVAGSRAAIDVLKLRSNPLIFGGPIPPPYLVAVCAALDVIASPEYDRLRSALDANVRHLVDGANRLGLAVLGGLVPIVSVLVGEEEATLRAGRFLFERGFYVQSVVFPAVPHGAGVLRMQVNANHQTAAIDGAARRCGFVENFATTGTGRALLPFPSTNGHAGHPKEEVAERALAHLSRGLFECGFTCLKLSDGCRNSAGDRFDAFVDRDFGAHVRGASFTRHGFAVWTGIGRLARRLTESCGSKTRRLSGGSRSWSG